MAVIPKPVFNVFRNVRGKDGLSASVTEPLAMRDRFLWIVANLLSLSTDGYWHPEALLVWALVAAKLEAGIA